MHVKSSFRSSLMRIKMHFRTSTSYSIQLGTALKTFFVQNYVRMVLYHNYNDYIIFSSRKEISFFLASNLLNFLGGKTSAKKLTILFFLVPLEIFKIRAMVFVARLFWSNTFGRNGISKIK